jgi:hypothetical protein
MTPIFGWELFFSIRSLYKYFTDPFDITIIGEIPRWIEPSSRNLKLIEYDDYPLKEIPQANALNKLNIISEIYDEFVIIHDDMYLIDFVDGQEIKEVKYYADDLYLFEDENNLKSIKEKTFRSHLWYSYKKLKELNKPHFRNFSTHAPFFLESKKLKEVLKAFEYMPDQEPDINKIPAIETAYYNYFEMGQTADTMRAYNWRLGFWEKSSEGNKKTAKVLNHDEYGFISNRFLFDFLITTFPKRAPIEK